MATRRTDEHLREQVREKRVSEGVVIALRLDRADRDRADKRRVRHHYEALVAEARRERGWS